MNEPIYTYKRGQGWVLGPPFETAELIMHCGTRVRIEKRPPQPGENYTWNDTNWSIERWSEWAKSNMFLQNGTCGDDTLKIVEKYRPFWLVMVPLD